MKRILSLFTALVMVAALFTGCNGGTPTTGGTSTITDPGTAPDGIVPGSSVNFYQNMDCVAQQFPGQVPPAHWMYLMVYETLFYAPNGDWNNLEGLLAKDWTVSEDGLIWVVNLQDNVKFMNGNKLTADSVLGSFDYEIANGQGSVFENIISYEATGEYQVTFTFKMPNPEFMHQFAVPHLSIFDYTQYKELGNVVEACYMAGSAPYYISDFAVGDFLTFKANPNYWNEERKPHIETLNCKIILDPNTQVTSLMTGENDFGPVNDYNSYETLLTDKNLNLFKGAEFNRTLWINADEGFCEYLSNPRVREALSLMIDMEQIAFAAGGGYGGVGTNAFNSGVSYVQTRTYDPAKGLAILAEEGIKPSDIILQALCDFSTVGTFSNLQAQFADSGVTLNFTVQDPPAVMSAGWNGEWDIWAEHGGLTPYAFNSPMSMLLGETGRHNVVRDADVDPQIWALVVEAFSRTDRAEEMKVINEIANVLDTNYEYLGNFQNPAWNAFSNKIQNPVVDVNNGSWIPWYSWVD